MNFYRKYRPQNFGQLIGQEDISQPLLKQLTSGKMTHAYLFSGPRGTGKTSTARIFAKAINCRQYIGNEVFGEPCNKCESCLAIAEGRYFDVLEIDAASNRGIDEIRDLREKIKLAPTSGQYKVYIIDEVHMLTSEAFNALLKTLEEPPAHAVFVLATTEPQKLPATILSRTQRFDFARPSVEKVVEKLAEIVKQEKLAIEKDTLVEIARASGSAFRDAEVLLDKIVAQNPKASSQEVRLMLGTSGSEQVVQLLELIIDKKTKSAIDQLGVFEEKGGDLKLLAEELVGVLREILLIKVGVGNAQKSHYSPETFQKFEVLSKQLLKKRLVEMISLFTSAVVDFRDSPIASLPLELAIIEACDFETEEIESVEETAQIEAESKVETPDIAVPKEEGKVDEIKEGKEEPKTKTIAIQNDSLKELQEKWPEVLQQIKPHNNSLEIFLRGARPVSFEENLLNLEVAFRFHKDRIEEPKNNSLLVDVFSAVLGKPVRIKGIVGERPKKAVTTKVEPLEEVDPVEIFGKLN